MPLSMGVNSPPRYQISNQADPAGKVEAVEVRPDFINLD